MPYVVYNHKRAENDPPEADTFCERRGYIPKIYSQTYCFWVYILKCADDTLYAGSTNNVKRRMKEHNGSKRGARYTRMRRPVILAYSETCKTLKKARAREAEIKRMSREEKQKLIGQ